MTGPKDRAETIVLPERLDIVAARDLRLAVLATMRDLVLDARQVTMMTAPAVQVLVAARDHQMARNCSFRIDRPSAGFLTSARVLGVPIDRMQTAEPVT